MRIQHLEHHAINTEELSQQDKASREPSLFYHTVSTVYFKKGILRADLWSQGTDVYETRIVHGPLRGPGPGTTLIFEDEFLPGV